MSGDPRPRGDLRRISQQVVEMLSNLKSELKTQNSKAAG
jgi:hypothetical protein